MAKSPIVKANEQIAEVVVGGYKAIGEGVTGGFQKICDTVVAGYTSIEDKFVDRFLTRDGETTEEAKAKLRAQNGTTGGEQKVQR